MLPRIHSAAQHTSHIRNPPLPLHPSLGMARSFFGSPPACVRPFASVRPWSVDPSVHRFSGPMRRWRGKSQSRVKDVCATLGGGGGVDRLQRRQVTIAIGWNGQIDQSGAGAALHPDPIAATMTTTRASTNRERRSPSVSGLLVQWSDCQCCRGDPQECEQEELPFTSHCKENIHIVKCSS